MKNIAFIVCLLGLFSCNQHSTSTTNDTKNTATDTVAPVAAAPVPVDTVKIEKYDNGQQKLVAKLKDGVMNGPYQTFYEDGKPKETGTMLAGTKTGAWRTFTAKGKLDKVEIYNNDQVVATPDVADYDLKLLKLPKVKLQVLIPKNWQVQTKQNDPQVALLCGKKCTEADVFCPNLSITIDKLDTVNFEQYIQIGHQVLKEQFPGFELINEKRDSVDGMPAYQTEYSGVMHNLKLKAITRIVTRDGIVYIFTAMAKDTPVGEFDKFRSMFLEVADSFRALQP